MHTLERLAGRRRAAVDAGLGVLFAVALVKEDHDIAVMHGRWWLDCVVTLVVCTAAVLRRRDRLRAAVAGLAVAGAAEPAAALLHLRGQPGITASLALFVLAGAAIRTLPVRPAAAVAAGAVAVAAGAMVQHPDVAWTLGTGWSGAIAAGLGLRLLDMRRHAAVEAIRRGERLELARELHDAAAHHVTGVVLQAQAARIAARRHADRLDDTLAGIEAAGTDALTSMRRVIGLLRDADDAGGLVPASEGLGDLVARFAARGPDVRLRLPDGPPDPAWPPELTATVYRVVQESLTNVARHAAGAHEVTVTVARAGRTVRVEVTDDGAGPPVTFPHGAGYGLVGMRERVEALGGTLEAGARAPAGWSVRAALPLPDAP